MSNKIVVYFTLILIALVVLMIILPKNTGAPSTNNPAPEATSTVSASGNIIVTSPLPNDTVGNPMTIAGVARVFENQFAIRLIDSDGTKLKETSAYASATDAGLFGPFNLNLDYPAPKGTNGTLEVFNYSPKDGSEVDKVTIPVNFTGGD